MTSATTAGDVYTATIEAPHGARGFGLAWLKGVVLAAAAYVGWVDETSVGDLVVVRTAPGPGSDSEVVRTSAGGSEAAAQLIQHVRRQLAELDPAAFEEAWGIEPPHHAEPS